MFVGYFLGGRVFLWPNKLANWEILHIIFPSWIVTMHIIKNSDKLCNNTAIIKEKQ